MLNWYANHISFQRSLFEKTFYQKYAAKFNAYQGMFHKDEMAELKKVCNLNKLKQTQS